MNELRQPKDMPHFRVDIRLYSPERYTFEEKKDIPKRLCPIENPPYALQARRDGPNSRRPSSLDKVSSLGAA